MSAFINGTGVISPQRTFDNGVLHDGFRPQTGNRLANLEPEYARFIDAKQIRRMSRIIRMGIVASILAARESEIEKPDAIIVGTAFGCLEDTHAFLSKLVQYSEDMLSPTAFIHSTHNTIAAQIALLFQAHGYNSTYVHRAFSFESALIDAMLLLSEGTHRNILAGGIDEITDAGFTIMQRLGIYRKDNEPNSGNMYDQRGRGSVAGEGSGFFMISDVKGNHCYAELLDVETVSFMSTEEALSAATRLLNRHGYHQPGLLMTGHNGDRENDEANDRFVEGLHCGQRSMKYKHLCGEYATATAFALWLAAEILKSKCIPGEANRLVDPENILIYNQQEGAHHSFILLRPC